MGSDMLSDATPRARYLCRGVSWLDMRDNGRRAGLTAQRLHLHNGAQRFRRQPARPSQMLKPFWVAPKTFHGRHMGTLGSCAAR